MHTKKNCVTVLTTRPLVGHKCGPTAQVKVITQSIMTWPTKRHDPLFRAFSKKSHQRILHVNVAHRQCAHFGHTCAGCVQKLKYRPISTRERVDTSHGAQQQTNFVFRNTLWQTTRHFYTVNEHRRVVGAYALLGEISIKHSHCGELSRHSLRRFASRAHLSHKTF